MTTPEQLQAWREEFETIYDKPALAERREGVYLLGVTQLTWEGYRRAKQETEQAAQHARKQALEDARDLFSEGFAMLSTNNVREIILGLLK